MTSPTPYFQDISVAEFERLLPLKLRDAPPIQSEHDLKVNMPRNAVMIKVNRLTQEINNALQRLYGTHMRPYILRNLLIHRTFVSSSSPSHGTEGMSISECELWYHRSGCSHGKVLLVQIALLARAPFLRMMSAHIQGEEPEDRMLLLHNSGLGLLNNSGLGKYATHI